MKTKENPLTKWILAAAAITAIIGLVRIGIILIDQITKKSEPTQTIQKNEKIEEPKKVQDKSEEIPVDVRNIRAKIGEEKVKKNNEDLWEADYGDGIIMVYIPEGGFKMGSNDYPHNYPSDEKPIHDVYLDGYWMGKYEVTFDQYDKYCKEAKKDKPDDEGWGRGKRPVINVSWDDAVAYCKWLSDKKGLKFKLPTEAQWEKAARGTASLKYPWGNHEPNYRGKWYANYAAHNSWEKRGEDGFEYTAPVGSYPQGASPYGLLDMAGNVMEWCRDWYGYDYYSKSPERNPTGPESGTFRVVRDGGWYGYAVVLQCTGRTGGRPSGHGDLLGFRLCQDNQETLE
ncbi:MAG: SUMF1/EgtB/PvdO family nonheme iron enzyme [Candidatus Aminicenantes bacterium]|nr:SUMF1/EgtB/PvdO family nonheme iron enzyme [Candidatus Aminicenantes bacterium]NIM79286.1 SUMF1/EgtB/PvdO family nonheme iron enzyme [Candidatus Aminicenantes bacterium]NIN18572.1 SUMF1/EgtB/PvdO family nonheme iron enzyme [Candidatus Aminicenantes bacterium]NIN42469.1 SUMF1/EgtB/PvdO family nonheme iron enzyme [Candidatus Aminicenantes bacterium]NIN85227.1 SUMF1/EgtB/PvdO family nonheme iron enzyme [Candidatus Aminicenantes bacterium]